MPVLRNRIDLETIHGYRAFELWQGDITAPDNPCPVDVVAVSYSGLSIAESSEVVGALLRPDLRYSIQYDLRAALGCWLSSSLHLHNAAADTVPFQRILGLDLTETAQKIRLSYESEKDEKHSLLVEALENVFVCLAMCEAKGIPVRSFALPVFGTGALGCEPQVILKVFLPAAQKYLHRSVTMERVAFFAQKASVADLLDDEMNHLLGRSRVTLPKQTMQITTSMCSDIVSAMQTSRYLVQEQHLPLLNEIETVLQRETIRSFEIGILGRRMAEMIVFDLLDGVGGHILAQNIDKLREKKIANWVLSYFQVLRHLGNESAHETKAGQGEPAFANEDDLVVGLSCILRVWKFWVDFRIRHPK